MPGMRTSRWLVLVLVFALPAVILWPAWQLGGLGAGEDDILYYYPSRVLFHNLIRDGIAPFLNTWVGLGRPLLADPQSAVFYPTTWLFAVFDPLVAYAASLWLHYALAFWCTYRLIRSEHLDRRAALIGATAFAFCGFMLAHRAHFTMIHAAAWVPAVFWRISRYVDCPNTRRFSIAALVAALACLAGHIQIAAIAALGSLVFLLARSNAALLHAARWSLCWAAAAGLFAVQLLPTLAYMRLTTRVQRGYFDFVENSWNPLSALGLALPMFFGQRTPNLFSQSYWGPSHQVEQLAYAGIVPLVLALARFGMKRAAQREQSWKALLVFAILLALGLFGPIAPLLYLVPGASVFRVPARGMVLFNLATALLAAYTIHDLLHGLTPERVRLRARLQSFAGRPLRFTVLIVGGLMLAVAGVSVFLPSELRGAAWVALRPWNPAVWMPAGIILFSCVAIGRFARQWTKPRCVWLLWLVILLDLGIVGWTIDVPRSQPEQLARLLNPPQREEWLAYVRRSGERLWTVTSRVDGEPGEYIHPAARGVANTNVPAQVETLTDYGPLQPAVFRAELDFKPWGEALHPRRLLADAEWMSELNIGWILLCDADLPAPAGGRLVTTTSDGNRLYHNDAARGAVFLEDASRAATLHARELTPDHWSISVDLWPREQDGSSNPPLVVVSRLALPGWRAAIDGKPLALESYRGLLLAFRAPTTGGEVILRYRPPWLYAGLAVTLATGLMLLGFVLVPFLIRILRGRLDGGTPVWHSRPRL